MSASWCPYCNSVKGILLGNVYCSRQSKQMGELETGTLLIKSKQLEETHDHVSRLSIRCVLSGTQHYNVGGHEHLVSPKNYLVVNQGQHYRTSFQSNEVQEVILVAFKPGFAETLLHSLITPEDRLLDDPLHPTNQPVTFFEKTYDTDPVIIQLFGQLRKWIDADHSLKTELYLDGIYTRLLIHMLEAHRNLKTEISKLPSVKPSTRIELFRRLCIAKDFMEANAGRKLKLDDIASASCLSVHHFKRAFKKVFGVSPHRYLIARRMEKAEQLLHHSALRIDQVCAATGFENSSSFIRLFKLHKGVTPSLYRGNKN